VKVAPARIKHARLTASPEPNAVAAAGAANPY
jgi:hypothetical protein